jgi:hypothetical protein
MGLLAAFFRGDGSGETVDVVEDYAVFGCMGRFLLFCRSSLIISWDRNSFSVMDMLVVLCYSNFSRESASMFVEMMRNMK